MNNGFKANWKFAWAQSPFKQLTIIGFFVLVVILIVFPFFFNYIELREGYTFNDPVLKLLPAANVSNIVFAIIWSMAVLTIIRCIQQPQIFIVFLWGFIFLSLSRFISILVLPLNPPKELIELKDPISNTFYGSKFITKDLFYSGHTATQFLMFLCLQKKWDKVFTLLSSIAIGLLVLIQHVHYSIDVAAAPLFTFLVFIAAKKITASALKSFSNLKV